MPDKDDAKTPAANEPRPTSMQEAAADQEAGKPYTKAGADKATLVVYQAGQPYPPPSGRPDNLWTQAEFDAVTKDRPDFNLYTVEGTKVDRGQAE